MRRAMACGRSWAERIVELSAYEKAAVALSVLVSSVLIADPLVLGTVRGFKPEVYNFIRGFTGLGRSGWILIPSGLAIVVLAWARAREMRHVRAVAYGYAAQLLIFLFAAVAASGLAASLIKNVLGRARPKMFEQMGALEFQPFTFDSDFASLPSGHATTAGALGGVLAMLWPGARIPIYCAALWVASTRFLIGAHYFTDSLAGFAFGLAVTWFLRDRLALRRWLFVRDASGAVRLRGRALLGAARHAAAAQAERLGSRALSFAAARFTPRQ